MKTQKKTELPEKTPAKPWTNLFANNRLAAKGMSLTFTPPAIIDGEKVVKILVVDVAEDEA